MPGITTSEVSTEEVTMSEVAVKTNSEDTKDKKGTPEESENFFP